MYTHQTAIQFIGRTFPSLEVELHDDVVEGLLHPQMGVFSQFAQCAINDGDQSVWAQITAVFMELWLSCDHAVTNALNVSFLEHLNFKDEKILRQWAFNAMPKAMRQAWVEMDLYNQKLHGG